MDSRSELDEAGSIDVDARGAVWECLGRGDDVEADGFSNPARFVVRGAPAVDEAGPLRRPVEGPLDLGAAGRANLEVDSDATGRADLYVDPGSAGRPDLYADPGSAGRPDLYVDPAAVGPAGWRAGACADFGRSDRTGL